MNMKTVLMAMAAIAAGNVCAEAQTAVWGGTGAGANVSSYAFETVDNWNSGYVPADGDNVDLSADPGTGGDRLYSEVVTLKSGVARTFGTVTGTNGRELVWNGRGSDTSNVLTLTDPSGFLGMFLLSGWGTLRLPATATVMPVVQRLRADGALNVDVPEAGTSATIASLFGDGKVSKKGNGDLTIGRVAPGRNFAVDGGKLTIGGHGEGETLVRATLAKAALQLDASAAGALVVENGKVVRWNDVRPGATGYAAQAKRDSSKIYNYPTVVAKFQNGLDVVDFGDFGNESVACDSAKSTSALQFNRLFTNVKDAFFVEADRTETPSGNPPLFATGISSKIFMRDSRNSGRLFVQGTDTPTGSSSIPDPLALRDGDFRVDGETVDPTTYVFQGTELKLLTFTPRDEATYVPMEMLAGEYGSRFGGIRVGEVLIFTNKLSEVERTAVARHLLAKWKPTAIKSEVSALLFKSAGTLATAGEGETLSVDVLQAPAGTTLTKTGEGALEIGRLTGADKVVVQGGSISVGGAVVPSDDPRPAMGAFRHYDASDSDSLVTDVDGNLIGWKDQSGDASKTATSVTVAPITQRPLAYPTVVAAAQNGRAAIDFGTVIESSTADASESAAMIFDTQTSCTKSGGNAQEVFFAFSRNHKGTAAVCEKVFLFGNRTNGTDSILLDFFPHYGADRMFRPSYASQYVMGGRWTLDGNLFDVAQTTHNWGDFHVYHGAFERKTLTTAFCMDRGGGNLLGGALLGEVLIYDRKLTDQERVDTEAYLIKRWLAKEHPAAEDSGKLASVGYAEGVAAAIGNETDLTVGKLTASSDALVKSGAGDLTVVEADLANLTSVTVEGGSLAFAVRSDNPEFHFDASDLSSFEYTVTDAGQTNVTKWLDVRKNGLYAFSSRYGNCKVDPILTAKERKDGVVRPLVDFGTKNGTDSAGMEMSKAFSNILECHSVFSDANGANTMFVFTDKSYYNFHRYGSNLFRTGDPQMDYVGYGIIKANGQQVYNSHVPTGFEVLSFLPTGAVHVSTIALDRTSSAGGCYVSEMVGFSNVLSPERHKYVMDMLVAKWGTVAGATMPVWTNDLQSITVKEGGVFRPSDDMAADFHLQSSSVAGGGTFAGNLIVAEDGTLTPGDGDAPGTLTVDGDLSLGDGATIACSLFPNDGCDSVKVSGALTCAGRVTVNVTSIGMSSASAFAGEYLLFDAADDSAVDASVWTVVADANVSRRCYVSLTQHDGKIWLKVDRKGSLLIVR